jgi:Tfp pilus assembly protein PilF
MFIPSAHQRWRGLFTAFFVVFCSVVFSSLSYAVYLLVKAPRPPQPEASQANPLPPDVAALLERAKGHLEKREVEQALLAYRRVLFTGPLLEAQLGLAEAERIAGREDVAAAEYERVLRLDSGNTTALRHLARIQSGRKETWATAEGYLRGYLALRPDDAEAALSLARLYAWQGKAEAAAEVYTRPEVRALLGEQDRRDLAFALVKIGRGAEAEPLLKELLVAAPRDRDLSLTLAGLGARDGDWDAALAHYRTVLEQSPNDARTSLAYGQGLLARKNYRAALAPLAKAATALPSSAEAALAYARAARGAGFPELAERQFERAVALDNSPGVARELADLFLERRRPMKAEPLYRRAYERGLRDDRLLLAFGGVLAGNGEAAEALPLLETVYPRQPSERLAYEIARLHKKVGDNERALFWLTEVERLQGNR